MALDIRNATTRFHSQQHHSSYGIQNWLVSNKFILSDKSVNKVDDEKYKELIKEFCKSVESFDIKKAKGTKSYENYIQNRFGQFAKYCKEKFANEMP